MLSPIICSLLILVAILVVRDGELAAVQKKMRLDDEIRCVLDVKS